MRDTLRLRQHLMMLACIPMFTPGCDSPPAPTRTAQQSKASEKADDPKAGKALAKIDGKGQSIRQVKRDPKKRTGPRINEAPPPLPPPTDPDERRMMPTPGDPPFIDGYNPEEEPCPSGNWCGTVDSALAIAPNADAVPKEMDCPTRIVGSHKEKKVAGPKYAGLSHKNNMQGSLNQHGTELRRDGGTADACCYHWFEYCSGRPLLEDGHARTAQAQPGSGWAGGVAVPPDALPEDLRRALADAWLQDAAAEHASIASFARVVLELLAVGAPADLVAATIDAGRDEVVHAQQCYAIASRLAGQQLRPGPLPTVAPREASLSRVAADALIEGCVGETIAALVAERAAARTDDPEIREALHVAARDEARHAALAWRTLRWATAQGGAEVDAAVRATWDALPPAGSTTPTPADPQWSAYGRLSAAEHARAVGDARRDIIGPMLRATLA